MPTETEKAAMKAREAVRARTVREQEMREQTEAFDRLGLPVADAEDVERTVAYLEALDEERDALAAFRDSLVPPP
jgi:hypothetical protein